MPQLDLVTFFDQTLYVYLFFIIQYVVVSTRILPGIYQVLAFKNLLFKDLSLDLNTSLNSLKNSFIFLEISESNFDIKIVPFV
jgi:hypothetical protein